MSAGDRVELVALGMRIEIPRDAGFEIFRRNRELLASGRTEVMPVELPGPPRQVLHLLLGGQSLALVEPATATAEPGRAERGRDWEDVPAAAEVFPDFDLYQVGDPPLRPFEE